MTHPQQLTLDQPPAQPGAPDDDGSFDWYVRYGPSQTRSVSVDQDGRRADETEVDA